MSLVLLYDGNTVQFDTVMSETHMFSNSLTEHPVEKGADITDHVRSGVDQIHVELFITNEPIGLPVDTFGFSTEGKLVSGLKMNTYENVPGQTKKRTKLKIKVPKKPLIRAPSRIVSDLAAKGIQKVGQAAGLEPQPFDGYVSPLGFSTSKDFVRETLSALLDLKEKATLVSVVTPKWRYDDMIIQKITMPRDAGHGSGAAVSLEFVQIRIVNVNVVDVPKPVTAQARAKPQENKGTQAIEEFPDDAPVRKQSALYKARHP